MEKEENAVQKDVLRQLHWLLFCWCDKYKTKGSEREEVVIDYSFWEKKCITSRKHGISKAWWQEQGAERSSLNHEQEVPSELVAEQSMQSQGQLPVGYFLWKDYSHLKRSKHHQQKTE